MASTDAKPVPQKNVAYRVTFPILDADGDLVTGATGLDSEVSKDAGAFADCTNEATEISASSGVYYLDLTSTEMNADTVAVIIKTSSSGAKTTTIVMYPEEAGDIRVNVTAYGGTAGTFSGGRPEVNTSHIAGSAVSTSSAQIGVNVVNAGGTAWGSGAITAGAIAADAIGASELAADAATEIADAVWATVARTLTAIDEDSTTLDLDATIRAAVGLASANIDTQLSAIDSNVDAILVDTGTDIPATIATVASYLDTEIAAILADTNELQTDWANGGRLDLILDARASQTSVDDLPTNAELATALGTADDAVLAQVALVLEDTGTTIPAQIAALENLSAAQVNAEVVDALTIDTYAEPGQGAPASTASLKDKIGYLYKAFRNRVTQTSTTYSIYNDAGSTVDHKATTSDDGTTFTRTEIASGP